MDITLPLPLAHAFTYRLPPFLDRETLVGHRAVVPFGRQLSVGIITGIASEEPQGGCKEVVWLPDKDPILCPRNLAFLRWMSAYYLSPLGQTLRVALSWLKGCYDVKLSLKRSASALDVPVVLKPLVEALEREGTLGYAQALRYVRHDDLLVSLKKLFVQEGIALCTPHYVEERQVALADRYFAADGEVLADEVSEVMKTPAQRRLREVYGDVVAALGQRWVPVRLLLERGISAQLITRACKAPVWVKRHARFEHIEGAHEVSLPELTASEQKVMSALEGDCWGGKGVASLQVAREEEEIVGRVLALETLRRGETSVWLVPNLASLSFWKERLEHVVGEELVVWSSQQRVEERKRVWHRLQQSSSAFVLATPSILLYPFAKLDRMVVIEEASPDYKQASAPRYHARDAAIVCAQHHDAKVLLMGAMPSLETYHNIEKGKYAALILPSRVRAHPPTPTLKWVTRSRPHPVLTVPVLERLKSAFAKKEQVILLHARRGYTAYTSCKKCGWQASCAVCKRGLTDHQRGSLHCHHCQRTVPLPACCPRCQERQLRYGCVGTQQLEETLLLHCPDVKVARIDRDETPYQKKYEATLRRFREGALDCLIGTQRLLRSLVHLSPDLLVWVDPHGWVGQTDFRASVQQRYLLEELLQHKTASELWVLVPERHREVLRDLQRDQGLLYRDLLASCRAHDYPPYVKFVKVLLRHGNEDKLMQAATALGERLSSKLQLNTLGPLPLLPTSNGEREVALWVKLPHQNVKKELHHQVDGFLKQSRYKQIRAYFDVDPMD